MEIYYRRTQDSYRETRPQQRPPQRRKKRRRRPSRALFMTALALLIAAVAVVVYLLFFAEREKTISMEPTPITVAATKMNTGKGMIYQQDGSIYYHDWTRESRNYHYEMQTEVSMSGSEDIAVVYTDTQMQIVGIDTPVSFTGQIVSVACGKKHIAVLRRDSMGGESILVLTDKGEQVDQLLPDDQYIVNFGFYTTTGEMLWIETLSTSASVPTTRISTYDLTRRTSTGVMQVQDQLIDGLYFTDNSMFAAGTNQIIRYVHAGNKEVYREMVYGYEVLDFSAASGTPNFLLAPREGDMHSVKLLTLNEADASGAVGTYLQLPSEGIAGYIMNGALVVVSREKVYTYTMRGKLSETASLELPVDEAIKLSDSMLLLLSNGTYYTAKVR